MSKKKNPKGGLTAERHAAARDETQSFDQSTEKEVQESLNLSDRTKTFVSSRYELLAKHESGGMGVVYRARHTTLDMDVAIKIMKGGQAPERFLREAKNLAQIRSPHVVSVHDYELLSDGTPLLVMDWIEGSNLYHRIKEENGPLDESSVLRWMQQTCEAMTATAEQGIIHRDLKPANILIDLKGNAKVADFGLALSDEDLSLVGIAGTPHYMAPEQFEDRYKIDIRSDIYGFGATFYHALTGVPPFIGEDTMSVLFKHKTEPLVSPLARNPNLSDTTSQLIERCLAKSPSDRFQSFKEIKLHIDQNDTLSSLWDNTGDQQVNSVLKNYYARRDDLLSRNFQEEVIEFTGGRTLRFIQGDIVEQKVDVIVCSNDAHLTMIGSGAVAVCVEGGPELRNHTRAFAPVRPGRVISTLGGTLPARFVFHAIELEFAGEEVLLPSRNIITELLRNCLYQADSLRVQSIAFPLLGSGLGGLKEDISLDTTVRFIARTFLHGFTSIQEVQIVLLDAEEATQRWIRRLPKRKADL